MLERFGFSKERIEQCLSAIKTLELEDALEWLVLHCPEKELLFDSANALTASVLDSDAPDDSTQASGATTPADFPSLPSGAATPSETLPSQKSKKGQNSSSVTQDPNSVSLAQEDVDAIRDRPTAAFVSAKLELFSIQRKLVSETSRNVAQLESIVSQSSKAYLFDKRDADAAVNMGRGQLDEQVRENRATARAAEAIKKEQENKELAQNDAGETSKSAPVSNSADQHKDTESHANSTDSASDGPASDTEGDLFGNLLDEAPSEYIDEATNMTIKVRSMPLPKQYAGKPPKLLLEDVVRRRDKFASKPVFSLLPGGNRAKRAMVTLRWDAGTQHVYSMHEEACPDQTQAYNYVATVALFNIDTGSVARQLAPAFRDLWGELEAKKKDSDEQSYRDHLKHIKTLIDPRLGLPVRSLQTLSAQNIDLACTGLKIEKRTRQTG